ncbi:MAG: YicC family protein [Saprospiraceae bacterium]|nr:YicC family protein [Saprospiraceae bacterium]
MVLSMTGYGQATNQYKDKKIQVEIKSLNGKTSDIRCKIPGSYKEKEIQLRKNILEKGFRGKFDFTLTIESDKGDDEYGLNKALFRKYYQELKELKEELSIESGDIVQAILRIPNVVGAISEEMDDEEWKVVLQTSDEAIKALNNFRAEEGTAAERDLKDASKTISELLTKVEPFELGRIETLKERFRKNLEDFKTDEKVDRNRFEQEIIYYLEKLDINEEKVRLAQHCKYFNEVLESGNPAIGKKLGFIAQEMGREINTLGAKANEKNIQQMVVSMKDALEKIKEQVANIV